MHFKGINMRIENDPKINEWLNLVCLSKTNNTRELYITVMRKYCETIGLSPSQLIELCENEAGFVYSKQSLPKHIGTFKNLLREKMSRTSRVTYLAAVSSFYSSHNITLSKKLLKREEVPKISIANDFNLKDEDITKAFRISEPLMKTIVAVQYTSGLSMSDVLNIKAGTIVENLTDDCITCLNMQRQKTNVKFHTFLSQTATDLAIKQISSLNLEDNDFLICLEKGKQMKEYAFLEMFRNTANSLGLKEPGKREYNKFHSHNLRKMFFNTILNVGGWEMGILAEYFMGHKIPDTRAAYFKATPEKLKEEYKKFSNHFEKVLKGDLSV